MRDPIGGNMTVDLAALLDDVDARTRKRLSEKTAVEPGGIPIATPDLYIEASKWREYDDVFAVSADLRGSTQLHEGPIWKTSTAAILDGAVTSLVQILRDFGADFVAVQGDGAFGLFTGERRCEKSMGAAVTVATYSKEKLGTALSSRWERTDGPRTGFRVGVARSDLLAKKVGITRTDYKEPVWAGRAVNYAVKIAGQVEENHVGVTRGVLKSVLGNDYLAVTCGCENGVPRGSYSFLWTERTFDKIGESEQKGGVLKSHWCATCGPKFVNAILAGASRREEVKDKRAILTQQLRSMS